MQAAGLIRFSLADFPGRTAAIVFTSGCNLRCPYCHNPELVEAGCAPRLDNEAVWAFLERRRGQLDGVVISGGEPTLHADLPDWCRRLKTMGYAIKLDTNGLRPEVLRALLAEGLADYVALDVKAPIERYRQVAGCRIDATPLRLSIALLAVSGVAHEFRTTVAAPLLGIDDLVALGALLRGKGRWLLQDYRPGAVLDPAWAATARPWTAAEKDDLALRLAAIEVYPRWRGEPEREVPESGKHRAVGRPAVNETPVEVEAIA